MAFLSDGYICSVEDLISPRHDLTQQSGISYGLSSCGYDIRLANQFRIPEATDGFVLDAREKPHAMFREVTGESIVLEPGSYILGSSMEYIRMPRDLIALIIGKSTLARMGIFVNGAPIEPEWEGQLTLSIANLGRNPVRLHAGDGIAQVLFSVTLGVCRTSYKDRRGKYQGTRGPTGPIYGSM